MTWQRPGDSPAARAEQHRRALAELHRLGDKAGMTDQQQDRAARTYLRAARAQRERSR